MRRILHLILVVSSITPLALGMEGGIPITMGSPANLLSAVRLIPRGGSEGLCTAVRVSRDQFLTAGHCADQLTAFQDIQVELTAALGTVIDGVVTSIKLHPAYQAPSSVLGRIPLNSVDLALITIEQKILGPVPFPTEQDQANLTQPVALVDVFPKAVVNMTAIADESRVTMVGGGCKRSELLRCVDNASPGDPLKFMATESISRNEITPEAADRYFQTPATDDNRLLHGDSGGPVFNVQGELVGINSQVIGDLHYHTRLNFLDTKLWLQENLGVDVLAGTMWEHRSADGDVLSQLAFKEDGTMIKNVYARSSDVSTTIQCHGTYVRGVDNNQDLTHNPNETGRYVGFDLQCHWTTTGREGRTFDGGMNEGEFYGWRAGSNEIMLMTHKMVSSLSPALF